MGNGGLQYYIHDGSAAFRFNLTGNLSDDGAKEIEQVWRTASSAIGDRNFIVDLSDVTEIGEYGRELLLRWHAEGATPLAGRTEARALLESIPGLELAPLESDKHSHRKWWPAFSLRLVFRTLAALTLLLPVSARSGDAALVLPSSAEGLALARYIVSAQTANPFHTREPVVVQIEASLPGLFKDSRVTAIRRLGDDGHSEYHLLQTAGDDTVTEEVIAPYLAMEDGIEKLPASSVAVTPANYRFHYMGDVGSGATTAYVFRITPRKKRDGLVEGELWIDAITGIGVLESGHLVKGPSDFAPRIKVVRDTRLLEGVPCVRVTHMAVETRRTGRGELTITEYRLAANGEEPPPIPGLGAKSSLTGLVQSNRYPSVGMRPGAFRIAASGLIGSSAVRRSGRED